MHDLIVVGGGPAGITATVYAINRHLDALLLSEDLGGKSNHHMQLRGMAGFEPITGEEIVRKFRSQVEYLEHARFADRATLVEARYLPDGRPGFRVTTDGGAALESLALIVASGVSPRLAGCPGEEEFRGRGVSYSAASHAPLYWGRDAAVLGSGREALRAAADLATLAARVYLIAPDGFPASSHLLDRVRSLPNVSVMPGHRLLGLGGGEYVAEASVRDPDGAVHVLPIQGLFVEAGVCPNTGFLSGVCELDVDGHVVVDGSGATSRPGLFAAGDVTSQCAGQMLVAVGDGARAAVSARRYLLELPPAPLGAANAGGTGVTGAASPGEGGAERGVVD